MIVVTSWDDGYPADMKVAELLDRHGLAGTFFVPIENSEGRPVMEKNALRVLDKRFEVGSHTHNHVRLNVFENKRIDEEISRGKMHLEEVLGHSVDGFCYPGGRATPYVVSSLRRYGVHYARTIENFRLDVGHSRYHVPTTLQVFPHRRDVYLRNFASKGNQRKRTGCFRRALTGRSLWHVLDLLAEDCAKQEGILHLWGHSWELEQHDLWQDLDAYFSRLKQLAPISKTVAESVGHFCGDTSHS